MTSVQIQVLLRVYKEAQKSYWTQKPTLKLEPVNAYGTRNIFIKDILLHFKCELYISVHVFVHL